MQFSLRTGFVVVTLLCMGLSAWVVPAERQRRAVKAIEAMGGEVRYNQSASEASRAAFLRRWLPPDYFDEVVLASLMDTRGTDAGLTHLSGLTCLDQLYLDGSQVTDAGLTNLKGQTNLQRLGLRGTQVTDAGLAHLQELTGLYVLFLDNSRVTDAGLVHLRELPRLKWLYLCNTQVTDAGVAKLQQALPSCHVIGP
jgi:hypothetical protein